MNQVDTIGRDVSEPPELLTLCAALSLALEVPIGSQHLQAYSDRVRIELKCDSAEGIWNRLKVIHEPPVH